MKKNLAAYKKVILFFIVFFVVLASVALHSTTPNISEISNKNKTQEIGLLNINVKIRKDSILDTIQNMKFDCDSSYDSFRNTKAVTIQKAVFDNVSYDNLPSDNKNFYSLFLKLIIIPSCSLFCLFIRRWITLVSNFKIGFIIIRYLHRKDGKKEALSF